MGSLCPRALELTTWLSKTVLCDVNQWTPSCFKCSLKIEFQWMRGQAQFEKRDMSSANVNIKPQVSKWDPKVFEPNFANSCSNPQVWDYITISPFSFLWVINLWITHPMPHLYCHFWICQRYIMTSCDDTWNLFIISLSLPLTPLFFVIITRPCLLVPATGWIVYSPNS